MPDPVLELEPGEELRAHTHASFRGAASASIRATFALGSARKRQTAYEDWRHAVESAGFPTAGAEMVLALTNRRLFVCRTTFWMSRPGAPDGAIDLSRIADVAAVRHGAVTGLGFALTNGQIIEVEAMRGAPLRRFARVVEAVLAERGR